LHQILYLKRSESFKAESQKLCLRSTYSNNVYSNAEQCAFPSDCRRKDKLGQYPSEYKNKEETIKTYSLSASIERFCHDSSENHTSSQKDIYTIVCTCKPVMLVQVLIHGMCIFVFLVGSNSRISRQRKFYI